MVGRTWAIAVPDLDEGMAYGSKPEGGRDAGGWLNFALVDPEADVEASPSRVMLKADIAKCRRGVAIAR